MSVLLRPNQNYGSPQNLQHGYDSRSALPVSRSELLLKPSSSDGASLISAGSRHHSNISVPIDASSAPKLASDYHAQKNPAVLERVKSLYKRLHLKYLLPLAFIMLYMFIGALLFLWIEGSFDRTKKINEYAFYIRERQLFLKRIDEIFEDVSSKKAMWRRRFLGEAVDYLHDQLGISFSNHSDWSLATALYYSGTIFTTIGYGDVACQTTAGRVITVVYAIVGIPLMLITLNDLGKFLYKAINELLNLLRVLFSRARSLLYGKQMQAPQNGALSIESTPNHTRKVDFDLSTNESTKDEGDDSNSLILDETLAVESGPPPRMPVTVAVGVTVGWIFFCALLFKAWEYDWSYAECCYFMFISLSTIGLGDLAVRRRDLMVVCFVFVIIGLSMVSMCINVIQAALEDLYIKILMKLLMEYQAKLAEGDDRVGASMGMMQMWGSSKSAKYLMPLLSKEKKMTAMAKVQDDANTQGIELPTLFSDIDEETGLPRLLMHTNEKSDSTAATLGELIQSADMEKKSTLSQHQPCIAYVNQRIQTVFVECNEEAEQTSLTGLCETGTITDVETVVCDSTTQYDIAEMNTQCLQTISYTATDTGCMTEEEQHEECTTQTEKCTLITEEAQTNAIQLIACEIQTVIAESKDCTVQASMHEENIDCETQTDFAEVESQTVQTPFPDLADNEAQTDDIEEVKSPSRISRAKRRIKRAFGRRKGLERRQTEAAAMSSWLDPEESVESEDEQSSGESLDWDPIDGMHAEKQRPVKDLTRFFEVQARKKTLGSPSSN